MVRDIDSPKNYVLDDGVGIDSEGYILTPGDDQYPPDTMKLATAGDVFAGLAYYSTKGGIDRIDQQQVLEGVAIPVDLHGVKNVLVDATDLGEVNAFEAEVYIGTDPGIGLVSATGEAPTDGSGTTIGGGLVGTVVNSKDLTNEDGPTPVQADITGNLGER